MNKVEGGDAAAVFSLGPCATQEHSFQHLLLATLAAATRASPCTNSREQGQEVGQDGHGDEFTSMAIDEPVPVDAGARDVSIMQRSTLLFEVLLSPGHTLKLPAPIPLLGKQSLLVARLEPVAVDKVSHLVTVSMEAKAKSVHDFFVWSSQTFTWAELRSLRQWSIYGVQYSFSATLIPQHLHATVQEATSLMLRQSAYPQAANPRIHSDTVGVSDSQSYSLISA